MTSVFHVLLLLILFLLMLFSDSTPCHSNIYTQIMAILARHQLNPKDIRFLRHKDTGMHYLKLVIKVVADCCLSFLGAPRGFAFVEFSSIEDSMRWMRETQVLS